MLGTWFNVAIPVRIYSSFWKLWCLSTVLQLEVRHSQSIVSLYKWKNIDNNDHKMMKNENKKKILPCPPFLLRAEKKTIESLFVPILFAQG